MVGNPFKCRLSTLHGLFQMLLAAVGIGHPNARIAGDEIENGLNRFMQIAISHIGDDYSTGHLVDAELVDWIELPNGFDLIAKELDAVRMVKGE